MTYSTHLNPPQLSAVRTIQGPLLILAGAGTGKTRVITSRIAHLLQEGVPASRIAALTFTNKAAKEMNERVAALVEDFDCAGITISTFHALCVKILRQDAYRVGYKSNFSIYDESDSLSLLRKILPKEDMAGEKLEPSRYRSRISNAKNKSWKFSGSGDAVFDDVFERYQDGLKRCNALDFDDLLGLTVRLFTEIEAARTHWQQRFEFLMIDEFQDTNGLQLEIVQLLSREHRNVCVVGDDDQSIYSWRGAQIRNILEFDRYFPKPKVVKLEQNYRSTNAILGTANSVIRRIARRSAKALWSERGAGEKVRLLEIPDDLEEAQYVIDAIKAEQCHHGAKWSDFAVLFRLNAQSRLFEEKLRQARIPYRIVGGHSFLTDGK
jgi:DNA helicase II / ATP-dependent DNA helicase PcrA